MKIALITGITGQDGSYLAELLLEKGYEVHGIIRRNSLINTLRIDHIYNNIHLHYGDLTDSTNLVRVIQKIKPGDVIKPNGTPRKVLNVNKIKSFGWKLMVGLYEGIRRSYKWYKENVII